MEIVRIFAENLSLCAVCYNDGKPDELSRLMELWQDPEYLTEFFHSNKENLESGFWGNISVTDAVFKTMESAADFEDKLERAVEKQELDTFFEDLDSKQFNLQHLFKQKSCKQNIKENWLRLYALKVESNHYIITGGAIKLTKKMQEAQETNKELQKFEFVRNHLISLGIIDKEGLEDLVILGF